MNTLNVVESIFMAALEKPTAEARAAYLAEACQGDANLRRCVERLLSAHVRADSVIPAQAPGLPEAETPPIEERPGSVIGPYKLRQQLGEGGFGVVFMAEQEQPVRRQVALKIIKPGMDSRQVVARFEAERQALALMDHPNIARVLDGGTTASGRPYFVMELVKGIPITEFCDKHRLTPRERLELFVPVCQAVQHAHQKGIIHRDLKPSNILVTMYDDRPVPKVIDFGVAKAIEQKLTEQTLFTRVGQVIGTLEYMSPEQASLNATDVDTRSDIYALGVLLYELLTGSTPLNKEQLQRVEFLEMLRLIREVEPPRPSTRLSQLGDGLAHLAAYRKSDSQKLPRLVRGELDWIVMKCLEKDRNRRYETANGLARDLERYLRDEPVQAGPPSALYRLRKLARRNKRILASAVLFFVLILAGVSGAIAYGLEQARLAEEQGALAEERSQFADEQVAALEKLGKIQSQTREELYQSLIGRATALRKARTQGFRSGVWESLREAASLNIPGKTLDPIRTEVLACLGDWVGLDPIKSPQLRFPAPSPLPEEFGQLMKGWQAQFSHVRPQTAVSPEGDRLVAVGVPQQPPVAMFSKDGKVLCQADLLLSGVNQIVWSPDGKLVVAACDEGVVVWTSATLGLRTFFRGETIRYLAIHPAGHLLATSTDLGRIELWSLQSHRLIANLALPESDVPKGPGAPQLAFNDDGRYLVATREATVVAWSVMGTPEKRILHGHDGGVPGVAFSPDGCWIASASKDGTVRFWDAQTGALRQTCRGHGAAVQSIAFSPDGKRVATGGWGGELLLWDFESGEQLARANPLPQFSCVWRIRFRADGQSLVTCGSGGIALWSIRSKDGKPVLKASATIKARGWGFMDFALHPNGIDVAYGQDDHVNACQLKDKVKSRRLPCPGRVGCEHLYFDRTGKYLTSAGNDGAIQVFDWELGKVVRTSRDRFLSPWYSVTPDLHWIATTSPANRLVIYDLQNDCAHLSLPAEELGIWWLEWSPDGKRVALGMPDASIVIWDLEQVRASLAKFGIAVPSTAKEG
jgi:serine/threonine protein kinase/WD40 repeat protein